MLREEKRCVINYRNDALSKQKQDQPHCCLKMRGRCCEVFAISDTMEKSNIKLNSCLLMLHWKKKLSWRLLTLSSDSLLLAEAYKSISAANVEVFGPFSCDFFIFINDCFIFCKCLDLRVDF